MSDWLILKNVKKSFGETQIIRNVNLNIKKEDNVGHSNKAVPIGLSALMS